MTDEDRELTDEEWSRLWLDEANPVLALSMIEGVRRGSERKVRLFACACARRVLHLNPDAACAEAVAAGEGWADGQVSPDRRRAAARAVQGAMSGGAAARHAAGAAFLTCAEMAGVFVDAYDASEVATRAAAAARVPDEAEPLCQEYREEETRAQLALLRDIFGNPFRAVPFDPAWRTQAAVALARRTYESRDFSAMPTLADLLRGAGCDDQDIQDHCRGPGPHVRGCWVVDLMLAKE